MKKYNIAIVGATGAVGQEMLRMLKEHNFPVDNLYLLASSRSKGKEFQFKGKSIIVEELSEAWVEKNSLDIALFSAGKKISLELASLFVKKGAVVIDNSSAFRMEPSCPLVIPEINPEDIQNHQGIIANPNCSTIIMLVPIWPIHKKYRIKRAVVSTYQAASGAGALAMRELEQETLALLKGEQFQNTVIPFQYGFNLFPHNSPMTETGYCEEEVKMSEETKKIFHDPSFKVTATCVRVPVLRAHSEAINIELEKESSVEELYELLSHSPGLKILEERDKNRWPMPIDASGKEPIFVGRIRKDLSRQNSFEIWVVGDQLLKGAALNAVQIAEELLKRKS